MGYDVNRFVEQVDEEVICPICFNVLEDPIQINYCEHSYCKQCINEWLIEHPNCPIDREKVSSRNLSPISRLLRVLLSRLRIRCENESRGCNHVSSLETIHVHAAVCEFNPKRLLVCTGGCGFVIAQDELVSHDCTKALMGFVTDQKRQIESLEKELKKLRMLVKEQKSEINLLKEAMETNTLRIENQEVLSWSSSLSYARVTRWGLMISTPDEFLQTMVRGALINSNCPELIIDSLMANCHEQSWPLGLRSLNTRQTNRRLYENYSCKRVQGKQAVVILKCNNTHMSDDFIRDPGFIIIFAHGIE